MVLIRVEYRMKVIAAYLLAVLGGNTCPTAEDVKDILGSGAYASLCCFIFYFYLSSLMNALFWLYVDLWFRSILSVGSREDSRF